MQEPAVPPALTVEIPESSHVPNWTEIRQDRVFANEQHLNLREEANIHNKKIKRPSLKKDI
jgi:hypothetical protein